MSQANRGIHLCLVLLAVILLSACGARKDISAERARELIDQGAILIDVRSQEEFQAGHIENALHIPHEQITLHLDQIGNDKHRPIVLYCKSGRRAGIAREALRERGYMQVYNAGGLSDLSTLKD